MSPPPDVPEVLALLRAATAADGVRPVSEEAELRLVHGGPPGGQDLVVRDGHALAGYARLDDGVAELVVHPDRRRRGFGTALLRQLLDLAGDRPLSIWAHGDLPGSAELLAPHGFSRARVLLQMRRDLAGVEPDPRPALPGDVRVLPFRPGRDEETWLAVNAAAFAHHPEQGSWTMEDLRLREAEPWFDPAGFLMAWRGDPDDGGPLVGSRGDFERPQPAHLVGLRGDFERPQPAHLVGLRGDFERPQPAHLVGFHWTKVHPPGDVGDEPVGEVYVLGIAPEGQGLGLGRGLTDLGLAHLRSRGLRQVLLYVDEDNAAAVHLYESRGFTRFAVDVSWHRPAR